MADLSLNSNALSGFAGTLRGLVGDFSQPIFVEQVCTDVLNIDGGWGDQGLHDLTGQSTQRLDPGDNSLSQMATNTRWRA